VFTLVRTTGSDARLGPLIAELDTDLRSRYGAEIHAQYAPFNHVKDEAPFVVALASDGTPVACGSFRAYDETTAEIKRLFVAPAARRRGVARAVVRELEQWAGEQGHAVVLLETGPLQREAIALYEQCGYARCEPFPPYVGASASVCMRKPL